MSDIHLIISSKKIDFLTKERYLKFMENTNSPSCFIYTRNDYQRGMVLPFSENEYELSDAGKTLLKQVLSTASEYYWVTVRLTNHIGKNDIIKTLLIKIKTQDYQSIVLNKIDCFELNRVYKVIG